MERTVTVTKTVSDKLPPDTVNVSVTTAFSAKKYGDAVRGAESGAAAAVAALKAAGFDGMRALGISVTPTREGGKQTGYRAARAYSLKFAYDAARLSACAEALGKCDCEWRLSFALEDKSFKAELIKRAVEQAAAEAEIIAVAAGEKVGRLCKAEYGSSDGAAPVMLRAAYCADNGMPDAPPESVTLTETVTCVWELL